ncbi:unnamed protein product [Darwinula stevensoni]|uniref:Uncharacterized protein n=1 Tax=Darwinula stevensoni TaxID=69355 RepID=A0A7R9FSH7_9CRUS|nr:unnamed protein product [Darwinula stevensoni]CAG0902667.1 unnamed protein product [Darwinula stevensoni]
MLSQEDLVTLLMLAMVVQLSTGTGTYLGPEDYQDLSFPYGAVAPSKRFPDYDADESPEICAWMRKPCLPRSARGRHSPKRATWFSMPNVQPRSVPLTPQLCAWLRLPC